MADEAIILDNDRLILLKKALARKLYDAGYDQKTISGVLSLTQPMVSNYLSGNIKLDKALEIYAKRLFKMIQLGKMPLFSSVVHFQEREGNALLAERQEIIDDEKQEIITDMTDAFSILKGLRLAGVLPKVKMNIARSKKRPRDKDDVASFLNGIIILGDRVSSISSIQFGKSDHLASLLLHIKSRYNEISSIMNIRYDISLKKRFRWAELTKGFRLKERAAVDLLFHKGDFGIEPCTYIIGKDARDVAKKLKKIVGGR